MAATDMNREISNIIIGMIHNRIAISPETDRNIRQFLHTMPVRVMIDLLSQMGWQSIDTFNMDPMEVDAIIQRTRTPYHHHFMTLLDQIRILMGDTSWFPNGSHLRDTSLQTLIGMHDREINGGITNEDVPYLNELIHECKVHLIGD